MRVFWSIVVGLCLIEQLEKSANAQSVPTQPGIFLTINPQPTTSESSTYLNFEFVNYLVEVLSTFTPEVVIDDRSILVSLSYIGPAEIPGTATLPSYFAPYGQVELGLLQPGDYTLTALASQNGPSASLDFTVVPELAAGRLALTAAALLMSVGWWSRHPKNATRHTTLAGREIS